jgi:NACalpha-BTF3-like transcription factor
MQDRFDPSALDKDFLKTMGIDMEDVEDLRNAIMQKAELLIAELT